MSLATRTKSPMTENSGERKLRTRLDILIALMLLQIILSIGIWVNQPDAESDDSQVAETSNQPAETSFTPENQSQVSGHQSAQVEPQVAETLPVNQTQSIDWSGVQIDVLNGCGVNGIANRAQKWLKANGFHIRLAENADRHDYKRSIIQDRSGNLAAAQDLAAKLNLDESQIIKLIGNPSPYVDLTLVIGQDYERLPFDK